MYQQRFVLNFFFKFEIGYILLTDTFPYVCGLVWDFLAIFSGGIYNSLFIFDAILLFSHPLSSITIQIICVY